LAEKATVYLAVIAIILSIIGVGYAFSIGSQISGLRSQVSSISESLNSLKSVTPTHTTIVTTVVKTQSITTTYTQSRTKTVTQTQTQTVEKVTLTVYGPWSGKEAEYFQAVINAYRKQHPNVEIQYVTMRAEDLATAMPVQFAAGTSPADVIITPWAWWIVKMAQKGYVQDVSGLVNENEYVSGTIDKVKWNGKLWGVPFTMWLKPGFWYRKSFFQKYGLHEPKSWNDFLSLLEKMKNIQGIKNPIVTGDSVGWPISDIVEHFIITFGGPQLQLDLISGKVKFNDEKVKSIFENYIIPLIKKRYFSEPIEWTTAVEKWWNGEYGLYFMGTWITGMVKDPSDLGFFPLPGCKGVVGGADYAFVPKFAQHKSQALDFLKYLATDGQVVHAAQPSGKIPTWTKVDPSKLWGPMQQVFKKVNELGLKILPDLDDSVGGDWQTLFWDQLKLLWVQPDKLNDVLNTLTNQFPSSSS